MEQLPPKNAALDRIARVADGKACFDAALQYLVLGWSALALCPPDHAGVGRMHGKDCKSPGKAPWGPWKEFQERLPSKQELEDKWHDNPTLNVGIALGPVSGLIGIDVDGPDGEQALSRISGGILPQTLEFLTPGGGRRLLYRIPQGVTLRNTYEKPGANQEVRFQANGGQTVMPPSRHANGGQYEWRSGFRPGEIEPADAPGWLVERLRQSTVSRNNAAANGHVVPEGARNDFLTSFAGSMRRRGMSEDAIAAALMVENQQNCEPPLDEGEVRKIAKSIARYQPASSKGFDGQSGYDIILSHFRNKYDPVFRRGTNLYSSLLGHEVAVKDATCAPGFELIGQLSLAIDAPRYQDGTVKRDSLHAFFSRWSKSAWVDLLDSLPEESDCAEISRPAFEDFEGMLRTSMATMVPLSYRYDKNSEARIERRALINWCLMFAKQGCWEGIRSYLIWTRRDAAQLRVAVRVEVFAQVNAIFFRGLTQNKFTRLCALYGLGAQTRIFGKRAIELAQPFIQDISARVDDFSSRGGCA